MNSQQRVGVGADLLDFERLQVDRRRDTVGHLDGADIAIRAASYPRRGKNTTAASGQVKEESRGSTGQPSLTVGNTRQRSKGARAPLTADQMAWPQASSSRS